MKEEANINNQTNFNIFHYGQVWEDADLLIEALNLKPNDTVLSIASAGDNSFALLAQGVKKVYGIDESFPQIACCELRKAMYRQLNHQDHLVFGGVIQKEMDRVAVFKQLEIPATVRKYWQDNIETIKKGFMTQGKFEHYFETFRTDLLPLIHNEKRIDALLTSKPEDARTGYYHRVWNNMRYKLILKNFLSYLMMERLGQDKEFCNHVEGSVIDRIHNRITQAMTKLDPSENPYLHFILKGYYTDVLPYSLRLENYEKIRAGLDKIEFLQIGIEEFITDCPDQIDAFNLSDIFECMSQERADVLYERLISNSNNGARLAYWKMLAARSNENLRDKLGVKSSREQNEQFSLQNKAFFYSDFYLDIFGIVNEVSRS